MPRNTRDEDYDDDDDYEDDEDDEEESPSRRPRRRNSGGGTRVFFVEGPDAEGLLDRLFGGNSRSKSRPRRDPPRRRTSRDNEPSRRRGYFD